MIYSTTIFVICCNETGDGEHYFSQCIYRNEWDQFFEIARDFQPLTINILLYVYETLDNQLSHYIQ